jgi:hypothetical protein
MNGAKIIPKRMKATPEAWREDPVVNLRCACGRDRLVNPVRDLGVKAASPHPSAYVLRVRILQLPIGQHDGVAGGENAS